MLDFIVLGIVPGTTVQVTLLWVFIAITAVSVLLLVRYAFYVHLNHAAHPRSDNEQAELTQLTLSI